MTRTIEPIAIEDLHGNKHEFLLTAAALRRVMRRLAKIGAEAGGDLVSRLESNRIESVFITAWEARVDKSATDEEEYFERFRPTALKELLEKLQAEQGSESDPTKATPTAPPVQ